MAHEFIGRIISFYETTGANIQGEPWKKADVTIVYDEQQYTKYVAFTAWKKKDGDESLIVRLNELYQQGATVKVACDINARQAKDGKWYNDIRCFRAELVQPYPQVGQPMPQQQAPMGGYPQQPMQQGYNQPMQQPMMQGYNPQQGFTAPVAPQPTITIPNAGATPYAPMQGYSNGANAVGDDVIPF